MRTTLATALVAMMSTPAMGFSFLVDEFAPKAEEPANVEEVQAFFKGCDDLTGTWKGTCAVEGNDPSDSKMVIQQTDCNTLIVNGQPFVVAVHHSDSNSAARGTQSKNGILHRLAKNKLRYSSVGLNTRHSRLLPFAQQGSSVLELTSQGDHMDLDFKGAFTLNTFRGTDTKHVNAQCQYERS